MKETWTIFQNALIATVLSCLGGALATADTCYVAVGNPGALPPYTNWVTAATDIQTAVNVAGAGDTVLVTNGIYVLASNISITKGVTVRSVNGAAATVADGNGATRCVLMNHADAVLDGFTVRGGRNTGGFGGGVNIVSGGTVQNCVLSNSVARDGGGVAIDNAGLVVNCLISGNSASNSAISGYGGGVRLLNGGTVRGCLIVGNESRNYGGGVNVWNAGRVENCTIVSNKAPNGAGIRTRQEGIVVNSIIYNNVGTDWQVNGSGYRYTNCCTPNAGALPGSGNLSGAPQFMNAAAGEYRLQAGSLCVDSGVFQDWMTGALDLDGHERILGTAVDIGAYENVPLVEHTIDASAAANGSMAPVGSIAVLQNASQTFSILPNAGYGVQDVLVDGVSAGAVTSYTFAAVAANHTINATFAPSSWRKAEFIVSDIQFTPAALSTGGVFSATVTILNQGDIVGDAGVLNIWINHGAQAATGEVADAFQPIGALAPAESRQLTFTGLTAPETVGTYTFRAFADGNGETAEKSEGNNQKTVTYTLHASVAGEPPSWMKPDFVVSSIVLTPVPNETGEGYSATVTVANQGDLPGDAGVLRIWSALSTTPPPGTPGDQQIEIGPLAKGESTAVTITGLVAPAVAGTYNARAFVDADNEVPEKSEGNNQKTVTYTLHASASGEPPSWMKPDFVVTEILLEPVPGLTEDRFAARITVRNQGDIAGDAGVLRVWPSHAGMANAGEAGLADLPVGGLPAGESRTLLFENLLTTPEAGTHHFRAMVDADGVSAEKSEGNNQLSRTYRTYVVRLVVTPRPDDNLLEWNARHGLRYRVYRTASLGGAFELIADNLPATPPTNTYVDDALPASGTLFYRVDVEP